MQMRNGEVLYAASDIVNFLECEHVTTLDLTNLETPLPKAEDDDSAKLVQAKGFAHEANYVARARAQHSSFVDIADAAGDLDVQVSKTLEAMRSGVEVIYQAAFRDASLIGHADFLRRVPRPSSLGTHGYEVVDTKLARTTKTKFIVQLAHYSHLLAKAQGSDPTSMHVVLGDQREDSYRYAEYARYYRSLLERFLARVEAKDKESYPEPCARCDFCQWRDLCGAQWIADDHLCQVAGITRIQTAKLNTAGVTTLRALAELPATTSIPKMAPATLDRVRHQARLQSLARETGERKFELLPDQEAERRGFRRLPKPSSGDLYFDMEGDPFTEGGLEYLFGLYLFDKGKPVFKPFWAHTRSEERVTFEAFMDFITGHLRKYPSAHIYHYAAYEETALKRLMSLHGTREAEVDNLLRAGKLIDLYRVVREAIRVSEPRYSLKNIEHFYLEARSGAVTDAGASVVYYDRWKETGDAQFLKDIEDYNHDDVRSTYELRQWLISLRPPELPWANEAEPEDDVPTAPAVGELTEPEKRLIPYRQQLVDTLPEDRSSWGDSERLRELTYQLLDFHRRAAKPEWWAMFDRMEKTEEELLDDPECLAGLTIDPASPPVPAGRSVSYTYLFPEQETKLKTGDSCVDVATWKSLNDLQIEEEAGRIRFRCSSKGGLLPARICIGPGGPIRTDTLTDALFRFADSLILRNGAYPSIEQLLENELPRIKGITPGEAIIDEARPLLPQAIEAIASLDDSYVFVQGPPGAGKTYTGSHVIVELLKRGFRVGVSSNSHKAINKLLSDVEDHAREEGVQFRGVKKSTSGKPDSCFEGQMIEDVFNNGEVVEGNFQLVAGTAWLFADADLDQSLDYLFVDEAGQVALANLVAMGTSASNIVLLGDQMQLGQPIQGVHPGRSGESSLEYLLSGKATIPPERGIFLKTTWRMHPDVCRFISDAVYDGRLEAEPANANQALLLKASAHPALKPTGVRYLPVVHDGCSQRSDEEAEVVLALYESLLQQRYRDKHKKTHPVGPDDILVVAPYNMQVNLLKRVLPSGARVGTVDKFQGQQAEVVIVSMATSSGDYLPRHIEFLYSKNRLNVAISRARCLALVIASPALMSIQCSKPEEMALVNTLCWVREVG